MGFGWIILPLFLIVFLFMWMRTTKFLMAKASLEKRLDFDPGIPLTESGWGSANINGVNFGSCIKLVEYSDGWLFQVMWIFGGGKLWLSKNEVEISELAKATFWLPRRIELLYPNLRITVYGKLADYISPV